MDKKSDGLLFVVHRHATTRPHFDFRLEIGKTMPSWAIPKGPTLDPGRKRLAMKVEDHDLEYRNFEGVIGEGEYGAGTVMIWDKGVYLPEVEAAKGETENLELRTKNRGKGETENLELRTRNRGKGETENLELRTKNSGKGETENLELRTKNKKINSNIVVIEDREEGERVMKEGLEKGELKFQLFGSKLRGSFALVKTKGFGPKNSWLMIKHKDEYVKEGYDAKEDDKSVVSKRTMEEIGKAEVGMGNLKNVSYE